MKMGQLEIPDNKLLIIGFPNRSQKEIDEFRNQFLKAVEENKSVFCGNVKFTKVSETDKVVVINAT